MKAKLSRRRTESWRNRAEKKTGEKDGGGAAMKAAGVDLGRKRSYQREGTSGLLRGRRNAALAACGRGSRTGESRNVILRIDGGCSRTGRLAAQENPQPGAVPAWCAVGGKRAPVARFRASASKLDEP